MRTFVGFLLLLSSAIGLAQQTTSTKPRPVLEFTQADAYARYRYIDNQLGVVTSDDLQYKFTIRPRINIPKIGTYFGSRIETGSNFASSWSNSGIGRSPKEWVLNAKTFFIGQRIGHHAEVEVGAMDVEQGAGTEASYTDLDAYTEGYRLRLVDLYHPYAPSRVVLHIGYMGDFTSVNAFSRLYRLGEVNYVQVLGEKNLGKWAVTSLQYDRLRGLNLLRGASKFNLPDPWWINEARIDAVGRTNNNPTAGWALHLTKTKGRVGKFNPGLYYSQIPTGLWQVGTQQALINGDVYGLGKRVGVTSKYQVTKAFDISTLVTRRVDSDPGGFRWRAQIVGRYQFAPLLKHLPL